MILLVNSILKMMVKKYMIKVIKINILIIDLRILKFKKISKMIITLLEVGHSIPNIRWVVH